MRRSAFIILSSLALGLLAAPSSAGAPEGWHSSLKDGVEAAAKSGKPILLITAWRRTL